jgi:Flp pilus assembly pilin Flp
MGPGCAAQAQAKKVKSMKKFLKNEDGLVTIEWVGIAAVMVLAAIAITAAVMGSADDTGRAVDAKLDSVNTAIAGSTGATPGTYGGYDAQ